MRLSFPHPLLVWSKHVESTGVIYENENTHTHTVFLKKTDQGGQATCPEADLVGVRCQCTIRIFEGGGGGGMKCGLSSRACEYPVV